MDFIEIKEQVLKYIFFLIKFKEKELSRDILFYTKHLLQFYSLSHS